MLALSKNNGEDSNESESSLNDDDVNEDNDDEFGMEGGGWCCFTNSLPIVYLRMWLNEKPNLTSFVSRQIPADVQCDSAKADGNQKKRKASDSMTTNINNKQKKSPSEAIAEAFAGFVKVKEAEVAAQRNNLTDSLGVELQSF